jgi:hypothetical protein
MLTLLRRNRQVVQVAAGGITSLFWMGLMGYALIKLL